MAITAITEIMATMAITEVTAPTKITVEMLNLMLSLSLRSKLEREGDLAADAGGANRESNGVSLID
jgi:hypothetical protein